MNKDTEKIVKEAERQILVNATDNIRRALKEYERAFLVGLGLHVDRLYGKTNPSLTDINPFIKCECSDEHKKKGRDHEAGCTMRILEPEQRPSWINKVEENYDGASQRN